MITTSRALARLARLHGVEIVQVDARQRRRLVSEDTLWRLLRAMRVELPDPSDAPEALRAARRAQAAVPPVVVAWDGRVPPVAVRGGRSSAALRIRLTRQTGDTQAWDAAADQPVTISGALPYGYHRLEVSAGGTAHTAVIVSAPRAESAEDAGFQEAPPSSRLFAVESGIDPCAAEEFQQCESARILWAAHATRGQVLQALLSSHRPLGAYEIIEQLAAQIARPAPITVYRALEFLMQNGLVHRIESRNAFLACAHRHDECGNVAFLICERCGSVGELAVGALAASLKDTVQRAGFAATMTVIEITGTCSNCQAQVQAQAQT